MQLAHDSSAITGIRVPTPDEPLRVLLSGCMAGWPCGVDGTDYGMAEALPSLCRLPAVEVFPFCPEDVALGTPRTMPDIHGGDGDDVLDGRSRILDEHGADLTQAMIEGAEAMLGFAQEHDIELAILTDMSGACGSQVISDGCRLVAERRYQVGRGVAAALLLRNGFHVVSQRDFRTLALLHAHLDPSLAVDPSLRDHHEHPWVVGNLGTPLLKPRPPR